MAEIQKMNKIFNLKIFVDIKQQNKFKMKNKINVKFHAMHLVTSAIKHYHQVIVIVAHTKGKKFL